MQTSVRTEGLEELVRNFLSAPQWTAQFVDANMQQLGRRIAYLMRLQVKKHRYTGALEDSIVSQYDPGAQSVEIGPTAKRGGRWDAGLLLQRGTGPIARVPFEPIRKWAEFRGLPAGPVWWKIKTRGVTAHPFLEETEGRGDVQVAVQNTAKRIGMQIAMYALQQMPGGGFASEPTVFGG